MKASVVYGFGGNAGVGAAQAGFDIDAWLCEADGFGAWAIERNRHLLPGDFDITIADPANWQPAQGIGLQIGTPPCAAFSSVNFGHRSRTAGIDSAWNNCMRHFVDIAARSTGQDGRQGPEVVAMESVPKTFTKGRPLLDELASRLRLQTGNIYSVQHLRVTNAVIGSAQLRRRYWFVASRIGDLGFAQPKPAFVTARDRLHDLEGVADNGDPDNATFRCGMSVCMICRDAGVWEYSEPGKMTRDALRAYMAEHDAPPEGFERAWARDNRDVGHMNHIGGSFVGWPKRMHPDKPAPTLTGQCLAELAHYSQRRHLTPREGLRLMGMPDAWTFGGVNRHKAQAVIGKAAPVESCFYVAEAAARRLAGRSNAGRLIGESVGPAEREVLVNALSEQRPVTHEHFGEERIDMVGPGIDRIVCSCGYAAAV